MVDFGPAYNVSLGGKYVEFELRTLYSAIVSQKMFFSVCRLMARVISNCTVLFQQHVKLKAIVWIWPGRPSSVLLVLVFSWECWPKTNNSLAKNMFVWNQQRIALWDLSPWRATCKSLHSKARVTLRGKKEAGRAVGNKGFHQLSCSWKGRGVFLYTLGLCCCRVVWEFPLLVSWLFNWGFCLFFYIVKVL